MGLAGAGFNHAWTTTKASAPCVESRKDEFIKGICSPGSYGLNPGRAQLDSSEVDRPASTVTEA